MSAHRTTSATKTVETSVSRMTRARASGMAKRIRPSQCREASRGPFRGRTGAGRRRQGRRTRGRDGRPKAGSRGENPKQVCQKWIQVLPWLSPFLSMECSIKLSHVSKFGQAARMAGMPIDWATEMPVVVFPYCPFDHAARRFDGAVSGLRSIRSGAPASSSADRINGSGIPLAEDSLVASLNSKASNS